MFGSVDSFALSAARTVFIDIARDSLRGLRPEGKVQALAWIELALEHWKRRQAGPDGKVEVDLPSTGLLGMTLQEMSSGTKKRRIAISKLQPWQCGGLGIKCDADLYARLAFGEQDPEVRKIEKKLPGIAIALLLERDGANMAIDSMAFAVGSLWIDKSVLVNVYGGELQRLSEGERARIERQVAHNRKVAKGHKEQTQFRNSAWTAAAANVLRAHGTWSDEQVAKEIRRNLPDPPNGKRKPSWVTIRDVIRQAKVRAIVKSEQQHSQKVAQPRASPPV